VSSARLVIRPATWGSSESPANGPLHRGSPTETQVRDRVHRSRLMIVAGNVTGGVLVVIGSAALAAGSDRWGWGLAAGAALVLALHARIYTNLDETVPVVAATIAVVILLLALTVLPRAEWPVAAAAGGGLALALAAVGVKRPQVRPLTRRRLARAEVICAVPLLAALLVSSGLAESLYRIGQNLT
jgi:hypothetical protein